MSDSAERESQLRLAQLSPQRRQLLAALRSRRDADRAATRGVLMRPGGEGRVVLIHPSGGALFCYIPLIRALPAGPAVVGFPAVPGDRAAPLEQRVVAVAARIAAELQRAELSGCVLAGWSYGGSVAFETARQLALSGVARPPVVLLDSPFVEDLAIRIPGETEFRRQFVYDLARLHGVGEERLRPLRAIAYGADGSHDAPAADDGPVPDLVELARAAGITDDLTPAELTEHYQTFYAAASGLHRYRPATGYPGPVHVLSAAATDPEMAAGWRSAAAGDFRHDVLAGDHYRVFAPDNLPTVVAAITRQLAATTPGSSGSSAPARTVPT
ncbi:thioesterase domain-containing protein [Kitasatospora sp. NPDC057223]|uniref:thioesterase domain-containing protein n=1 Tax=Kitasatospora sp. NPDC057223 TaxID=3346055 RepID=UPI003635C850